MSTTAQDSPFLADSQLGCEPLVLRIRGGGLDGRVVRLASPKCTIGSGPRCTLRLVGPGVRPLHCLIIRGSRGTFIRRWSPDTRLNGRLFEDATLHPGDRLTVGPLDLEVLDVRGSDENTLDLAPSAPLLACPVPAAAVAATPSSGERLEAAGAPRVSAQTSEDVRSQIARLGSRAQNLVQALRTSRQQQEELEARVHASLLAQSQAESNLAQITSEAREAAELQQRVNKLSQELEAYKERERSLVEQLERSKAREAALQSDVEQASSAHAEHDQEIEARLAELEHERNEIEHLRRELQAERDRLATERAACEAEKHKLDREGRGNAGGLPDVVASTAAPPDQDEAQAAIARLREHALWNDRDTGEERENLPVSDPPRRSSAPTSFIEKYAPHLLDNEPEDADSLDAKPAAESGHRTTPGEPADPRRGTAAESADSGEPSEASAIRNDDEESLEDYMAKLLQRVRGDDPPRQPPITKPQERPRRPATRESRAADPPAGPVEVEKSSTVFRWEDVKRAPAPPERSSNFEAMRELANQSAHSAISVYRTQRTLQDALAKLVSSGVCLASGIATLYLAPEWESTATVGGGAALLAASYFGICGTASMWAAVRSGRLNSETHAVEQQEQPAARPA